MAAAPIVAWIGAVRQRRARKRLPGAAGLSSLFPPRHRIGTLTTGTPLPRRTSGKEQIVDFTPEEEGPRPGEAVVFWSWIAVLAVGLAYMILIPLSGR
jgi:hypothetical protein